MFSRCKEVLIPADSMNTAFGRRTEENSFMSFRLLLATNGSCGCLGAVLTAGRELRRRGHAVRLIADQAMRAEVEAAGFEVSTWKEASTADAVEAAADPSLEDWLRRAVFDPIAIHASEIRDELDRVATDAILSIDMLFGAALAAEAAGIPIAMLSCDVSVRPLPGVPPRGKFAEATENAREHSETVAANVRWTETLNGFLPALNKARLDLGLAGLSDASDQFDRAARFFIASEQDFDPQAGPLPENVRYVGSLRQESMHDGFKADSAASSLVREMEAIVVARRRFRAGSFSNEAGTRPYRLYVPSGYDGSKLPLVVMLHGCLQSPDDFASGTRMNLLAEDNRYLICYPQQIASANVGKCWNWFEVADQQRDKGEPAIIAGITREVMSEYAVDAQRVYVAGLSAGGATAATMGQLYPDLYAAVGVHSGLPCGAAHDLDSAFSAMSGGTGLAAKSATSATIRAAMPTIVFHGDLDTTVNPINGDEVTAQALRATRVASKIEEEDVTAARRYKRIRFTDTAGHTAVEQWTIHDVGHAWSGGSKAGSFTDPNGPDASSEMLRFFLEHPRRSGA
jgi:poly(hydroxyalkanoate) depolymerase family esterase